MPRCREAICETGRCKGSGKSGNAMKLAGIIPPDLLRFGVVIVAGLVVDLSVGVVLTSFVGVPLVASAAIGFFAGALFNYVVHEKWTFGTPRDRLSVMRATLYLGATLLTLAVRMLVAFLLTTFATGAVSNLTVLFLSACASFFANYLLSRFVVYRKRA